MDIARSFPGFVVVALAGLVSACGGGDTVEVNQADSQATGGAGGSSGGSAVDASAAPESSGGSAGTGLSGTGGVADGSLGGSGGAMVRPDATTQPLPDATGEAMADVRIPADGPVCIKDPSGICDCIAQCYVSSDCPAERTCQCAMGPCFCHRCVP